MLGWLVEQKHIELKELRLNLSFGRAIGGVPSENKSSVALLILKAIWVASFCQAPNSFTASNLNSFVKRTRLRPGLTFSTALPICYLQRYCLPLKVSTEPGIAQALFIFG